jgi:N-acyl-D-amino-acid deacylase
MFDLIIGQALVIDGSGQPAFEADLGIAGGKIQAIGRLEDGDAHEIDASGLVCAPGFVDMHSHSDLAFFWTPPPEAKIRQGITTELIGQDGLGVAPVKAEDVALLSDLLAGLNGKIDARQWSWQSFGEYLDALGSRPLPNNVAVLASHGPVRLSAMGMTQREAGSGEIEAMRKHVRAAMEAGAFGFSTGLIYPPCSYAPSAELIALNREVAARDGIFVVHQRDEGHHLSRSFNEVCDISRQSGARLHVSHLQAYGRINWPIMEAVLDRADRFLEEGGTVTWDRYPYLAGSTVLTAVLPPWTLNQGPAALVSNLMDPVYRTEIHREFGKGLDHWHNRQITVGWENILVSAVGSASNRWMEGLSCREIASRRGQDPIDMVCDLLAEERLAVTMISFYGSEDVLDKVLTHAQATVGSDGIYGGRPHPRLYGTYPRFIERFVRDKGLLSLEEAVRKVTSFPAGILGIAERGLIRKGYFADLVIFDPQSISDTATYAEPRKYPTGIAHVLVNGCPVVSDGQATGNYAGRILRK